MRGVVIALVFFALGLLAAGYIPIEAGSRMAFSDSAVPSSQRIPFDSIKVFNDKVVVNQPGIKYARVESNSMAPLITDKSVVFEKPPEKEDILKGDVISFYEPSVDGVVLHLVTDVISKEGRTFFRTKGVANPEPDPWLVPFENVKGVLVGTFR